MVTETNASPERPLYDILMSETAFDQWIERHTGLPIRLKIVGFYTGMQLGSALGLGILGGIAYRMATGHGLTIPIQFSLTVLTLFVVFSWQARKSSLGFWINGILVAVLTSAGNIVAAYFMGRITTGPVWPVLIGPLFFTFAMLTVAGLIWRGARERSTADPTPKSASSPPGP